MTDRPASLQQIVMVGWVWLVLVSSIVLSACATNQEPTLDQAKQLPEKRIGFYENHLAQAFVERVAIGSAQVLTFLQKMDANDRYRFYQPTTAERQLLADYFGLLPVGLQQLINQHVIAVYCVENFMGGALTDFVFDQGGQMELVMYLNADVFKKPLDEWLAFRDASVFKPDGSTVRLRSECPTDYRGLLYVLVHEAAHVYDYYFHATPYVEPVFRDRANPQAATAFTQGIWANLSTPVAAADFALRAKVHSYGLGEPLPQAAAADLYRGLSASPFSSLYGSANWAEDWAETWTWYYLGNRFHLNYTVTVEQDGRELIRYNPAQNSKVIARYPQLQPLWN